jgi:hypothetical protein
MDKKRLDQATSIIDSMGPNKDVKRIKNEKGLFERTQINKVIITEDNKMLLND